jgi:hypothetical protein
MDRDSSIRQLIPIFLLLMLSFPLSGFAQESSLGPTPASLREVARATTPPQYRIIGPVHCGPDGGLYAAALRTGAGPATTVIRFNGDLSLGQPSSVKQFGNPDEYSIYDYAPDGQGGLFAIVINMVPRSASIDHFDRDGRSLGLVPVFGIAPKKVALFADGDLLIGGVPIDDSSREAAPSSWVTGVFRPDGTLVHGVALDLTSLVSDPSRDKSVARKFSSQDWETIEMQLDFHASKDGSIYVGLPATRRNTSFGTQSKLAAISPSGEVTFRTIPGPKGAELFDVAIADDRLFAVFGTRGSKGEAEKIDDLREFALGGSGATLDLLGSYKTLGAPSCINGDRLLIVRPDGKGAGGMDLVSYALP